MKSKIIFPALALALLLSLVAVALPQAALADGSPWIYLNPESSPSGRMVAVTGWGFTPDAEVGVYFDEGLVVYGQASSNGDFIAYFYVAQRSPGSYIVKAVDEENLIAWAYFTVRAEIGLYPDEGHVGRNVQVTGKGFEEWSYVTIYYDNQMVTTDPALIRTGHHGYFTASFTVPESTVGEHRVMAVDGKGNEGAATFEVVPKISISRDSGVVGTEVRVEGTGFKGWDYVTIYYDNQRVTTTPASVRTNHYGSFTATFTVPESEAAEHTVKAVDAVNIWATAAFHVSPGISLDPSFGAVGEKVEVEGTGFEGNSIITIHYDNEKVNTNSPSITTNRYGSFTATFIAPKSVGGKHTVVATDKEDNEGGSTFTMESTPPLVPNLSSPGRGAETTGHTPTLDWSDVTDPSGVRYSLQVANNPQFSSLLLSKEGLTQSQYTLNDEEALGRGTYYWRVKAIDGASNESSWSIAWSFNIVLLPTWALIIVIIAGVALVGAIVYCLIPKRKIAHQERSGF